MVEELANIEEPLTASAYEMEININGIGFQVLKYLATENPYYRSQALQDDKDFWGFHRRYMQLSKTERQRALGDDIGSGYRDFWLLAEALIKYRDEITPSVERLIEERRGTVVTQRPSRPRPIRQSAHPGSDRSGARRGGLLVR